MWFGDERRYYTTGFLPTQIRQSCGLVMKEDITQQRVLTCQTAPSCGLVMKEDITQPQSFQDLQIDVVVW